MSLNSQQSFIPLLMLTDFPLRFPSPNQVKTPTKVTNKSIGNNLKVQVGGKKLEFFSYTKTSLSSDSDCQQRIGNSIRMEIT
jgi:hypothetical protein